MEIELVSASPQACHPTVRYCALCWLRTLRGLWRLSYARAHRARPRPWALLRSLVRSRLSHSHGCSACARRRMLARGFSGTTQIRHPTCAIEPYCHATVRYACTSLRLRLRMQRGWPPRCGIARASVSRRTSSSYALSLREYCQQLEQYPTSRRTIRRARSSLLQATQTARA